jgi:uncharacterized protein (TIRG00374 family)
MKKALQVLFVMIGFGFFAKMFADYDFAMIWNDVRVVGWGFSWLIVTWLWVVVFDTITWRHTFVERKNQIGYGRLMAIMMAGQAVNALAPSGNLGEWVKGKHLSDHIGKSDSISSLILYNFFNVVGSVIIILLGTFSAFFLPEVPDVLRIALGIVSLLLIGWVLLLLFIMKKGMAAQIVRILHRLHILKSPQKWIEGAARVDSNVRLFYKQTPKDFFMVVGSQVLSRSVSVFETYLVCLLLKKPIGVPMALFLSGASVLMFWMFSMVPSQIGVMEQGSDGLFQAMHYRPGAGFVFELVRRARRVLQIAVGLMVLVFLSLRSARRPLQAPNQASLSAEKL